MYRMKNTANLVAGNAGLMLLAAAFFLPPHARAEDLTELGLEQLLETHIVGASKYEQKQSEVAAAATIISRDEIKAFGWRTLAEALASLPGIHTTYDRQYAYLGTRGFGLPGDFTTRILLAINGNRANDALYDYAAVGRDFPLDMDLIERIEFIPGPGGAVYGQNAMFGVVNVVTRTGAGIDGGELSAAWQNPQSARQGRVTWGKLLDNGLDVVMSASGYRASGEDRLFDFPGAGPDGTDVAGVARGLDGERDKELYTRLARGPWSFELVYGNRRKDDPTATYFADPLAPGQYQRDSFLLTQLQYQDRFAADTLHVFARLFVGQYRYSALYHYSGAPNYSTGASDWHGAELRLLSTALPGHKVMLGLEAQANTRIDQGNDDLTNPGIETAIHGSGHRVGIYAQDEWRLADTLLGTLGIRLDQSQVGGAKLSPRVALIWQASQRTTLKALYGRAYRAPNAYERDYSDGITQVANPGLRGESIDTEELVADHRVSRDLALRASLYRWTIRDIIALGTDPVSGFAQYQSDGTVNASGLELSADRTWTWGGRLRGSIALQDVAYANGGKLDNSPHWLGKLNFSTPLPWQRLRLGYELQYDSKRQAIDGTELSGYYLANLNLRAESVLKGLDLSLGIYNLFDRRYQHPAADTNWQRALVQDGRTVLARFDFRF